MLCHTQNLKKRKKTITKNKKTIKISKFTHFPHLSLPLTHEPLPTVTWCTKTHPTTLTQTNYMTFTLQYAYVYVCSSVHFNIVLSFEQLCKVFVHI
jgi:hypothetical protein